MHRFLTLALVLLAASVAAAQKVDVQFDPAADFSRYHSFNLAGGQLTGKDPALDSDLNRKRIEDDIVKALTAKGLTQSPGRADLNVRYHLGASRRKQAERYPAGWRGLGTRVVRVPYAEGTLVIDLRDTASRSLVWRGIAREEKSSAADVAKKLDDMVRKTLSKYPPKK